MIKKQPYQSVSKIQQKADARRLVEVARVDDRCAAVKSLAQNLKLKHLK